MQRFTINLLILGGLCVSSLPAQTTPTADYISQVPFLQRVLTGRDTVTTSSPPFVPFVDTTINVPAGFNVLLSARFSAESRCTEIGSTSVNWCEMRILIGGVEAEPAETSSGADFAFDSTDSGTAQSGDYESHSMDRHLCYRNTSGSTQQVPVKVEWGVSNLDGGSAPLFWIDDWSLVIQESRNCIDMTPTTAAEDEQTQ